MKLGCSSWSYHAAFRARRIDLLECLRVCGDEMELDGVELVDLHFPTTEPAYLRDIKRQCVRALQLTIAGLAVTNDFGIAERRDVRAAEGAAVVRRRGVPGRADRARLRGLAAGAQPPPATRARIVGLCEALHRPRDRRTAPPAGRTSPATLRQCADYAGERGVTLAVQNSRQRRHRRLGAAARRSSCATSDRHGSRSASIRPTCADRTGIDAALPFIGAGARPHPRGQRRRQRRAHRTGRCCCSALQQGAIPGVHAAGLRGHRGSGAGRASRVAVPARPAQRARPPALLAETVAYGTETEAVRPFER